MVWNWLANWLANNWGNLASVIGLLVSIFTLYVARQFKRLVEQQLQKYRKLEVIECLIEARTLAAWLASSSMKQFKGPDVDRLRACLTNVNAHNVLTDDCHGFFRIAIAELRRPQENCEGSKSWLRKLAEEIQLTITAIRIDLTKMDS